MSKNNKPKTNENTTGAANKSTEKIKRNFLALSREKKEEALALLLELAETVGDQRKSEHLIAVHNTLKNLDEKQNGGQSDE